MVIAIISKLHSYSILLSILVYLTKEGKKGESSIMKLFLGQAGCLWWLMPSHWKKEQRMKQNSGWSRTSQQVGNWWVGYTQARWETFSQGAVSKLPQPKCTEQKIFSSHRHHSWRRPVIAILATRARCDYRTILSVGATRLWLGRMVIAESSKAQEGATSIQCLSYGKTWCYLTWLRPKTTSTPYACITYLIF